MLCVHITKSFLAASNSGPRAGPGGTGDLEFHEDMQKDLINPQAKF